jgi:hypothetical protein
LKVAHTYLVGSVGNLLVHGVKFLEFFIKDDGFRIILVEIKSVRRPEFSQGGIGAQGILFLEFLEGLGGLGILLLFQKPLSFIEHPLGSFRRFPLGPKTASLCGGQDEEYEKESARDPDASAFHECHASSCFSLNLSLF